MKKSKNERHYSSTRSFDIKIKLEKRLRYRIGKHIKRNYEFNYNKIIINDIIFNETTKLVATFKDFLIFEDNTDFLKR